MTTFRVGQRVRIVSIDLACNKHLLGREAVVTEVCDFTDEIGYGLDILPMSYTPMGVFGFAGSQLEPILGSKHEACDEEFKRDLDKLLEGLPA